MSEIHTPPKIATPPKRTMPYKWGQQRGGNGGGTFDDSWFFEGLHNPSNAEITSLQVNHGDTLDHLVVTYYQVGNPRGDQFALQHGNSNGGIALLFVDALGVYVRPWREAA